MTKETCMVLKPLAVLATLALLLAFIVPQASAQQSKLKVGIIHIGSMTDGGYNQAHAEGIAIMKKNLPGVEVIEVENVPETADLVTAEDRRAFWVRRPHS